MVKNNIKQVLIMAGGTGGHIFPALAIAKEMQLHNIQVHWLGTKNGLEATLVPDAGFPLHYISIAGIRGKGIKALLSAPWRLMQALWQAVKVMRLIQPDVVLGFGGFVAGPGGIAAKLLAKRLIIHEQNAIPGFTNKMLSLFANRVLQGFPNTFSTAITTGNPVRKEIAALAAPAQRLKIAPEKLHLLVLGGSLGASAINHTVPKAVSLLSEMPLMIRHQTGAKHLADTAQAYEALAIANVQLEAFINDMAQAYAWADVVLCRAGALTIAELSMAGVPAILVPFPHATDDHQTINANYLIEQQAAWLLPQHELNAESLAKLLRKIYQSREQLSAMATAAYGLREPDAVQKVLQNCEEICS